MIITMRRRIDENQTHTQRKVRYTSYKRAEHVKLLLEKKQKESERYGEEKKRSPFWPE